MTYGMLKRVFEDNHIPEDAILMSDSGWECDPTHMDGIFYNKEANVVVFINFKINMHIFYQINMYKFKFTLLRRGRNFAVDKISL